MALSLFAGSLRVAGSNDIPSGYQAIAAQMGVSARILYAVALTESGQTRLSAPHWRPWPWTLNIEGEGHYFASRHDAWRALRQALSEDKGSVDIGLMQVNWRYHWRALGSPWQSLDPYHNLRVGADILKDCHPEARDWWDRVGCYHAPNDPTRAHAYLERVRRQWRVLGKDTPKEQAGWSPADH